ncbi:bifunctional diguanylate cyclase/phosphodiesterase [Vibrio tubiashii]|uniref:C-di-GMP phosphodiesterase n=1 Tax=Vibrio tubiashii ATCC 19109 TaxID=1051646 RepID=F9T5U0_9VIBR|nr:EAL domain-containing protein [Vibrio tubiashii]AIW13100.1 c-di-GMP phosphodiesterase [Vibrio tubiashii ATCC 19109]EGU54984.1 sensory box/GGDEF family protein [Vibrio tubiashii ATCC 19109]EIF01957.1 sensory box/GGDEF family protein [Vibrio tubiashii NCIMB 1337 = ATCC 19106]MCG9574664.1 EAL domain-containing protein [Vibrio tubiashii]MCG9583839.1 EAL domain-containing protein [Vibrio tubiashii]
MPKSKKINSLAFRQAKTVFLVSVILGICFSFYHILVDLHQEQKRIEEHYQFKLLQNYSNASQAAYHLNQLLAEQVASSLMMDNAVYKVQIVDDFGDTLTEKERNVSLQGDFTEALSSYLTPTTPIYTTDLHQPNSHVVVGTLSFSVNGANIAKDFIAKTSQILLFDLFRNILLTSILLMFFYQKLSKPLVTLIEWVRSLQNTKSDLPPPTLYRDDELGQLAKTFHTLWKEREAAAVQLNQLAYYDSLTGLANRSLLLQMLKDSIEEANTNNQAGALFYLDLDRFKTINDSLGHTIGDNLIKAISKRIEAWLRDDFTAARIGGDEFAILLPNTSADKAHEFAQQLLALISNPYSIDDHQLYCTVSVGIAIFPSVGSTNIDVLRQADTALYRAKTAGRNKYMFYEPEMQAQVESFLEIEKGLHEALNQGQLELYYQPQVDDNHNIIGVEALIRWNHPQKGVLPPGVFMPIAEETGQILQIGNWIIEQACYQFSHWKKEGILPSTFRRLAINISPLQFSQPSFVEHIVDSLAQADIDGEHIELEITENLLLENVEAAIQKMAELKEHNLKTSIDDFGTGYSSLRYLKHLSVDVLKIDRSFVTQLHLDESDQAIVDTIIMTARRLNLEVIAEGVEDANELNALKQLGCAQFQGYLFDKPLPASELNERFEKNFYPVEGPSVVKAVQK